MKRLLWIADIRSHVLKAIAAVLLLLALTSGLAHASVGLAQVASPVNFTTTAGSITFTNAVTSGDYIFVIVTSSTASSPAPSSVTDTNSDSLITVSSWTTGATSFNSEGVYAFHVGTGGSGFNITVNFTASNTYTLEAFEVNGVGASLTDGVSAVNTGASTSPSAASLTPTVTGDLQVAIENQGTVSSWSAGLTQQANYTTASPHAAFATQSLSSTSSVSASATLSSSSNWSMLQFLIKSTGSACTHFGITQAGALAVPNGTSGSYLSPTGTYVTPDCSTVQYWQLPANECGGIGGSGTALVPSATAPGGVASIQLSCAPTYPPPNGSAGVN